MTGSVSVVASRWSSSSTIKPVNRWLLLWPAGGASRALSNVQRRFKSNAAPAFTDQVPDRRCVVRISP